MASRYEVEVKVKSARDLKNVNWRHGPVKAYAVVWVDPARKVSTRVDEEGDTCPRWDETLVVPLDRPIEDAVLYIDIVHAYAEEDTKPLIGSAKLPLRELVDDVGIGEPATRELKLKRPSGRPQGKVEVQVCVRDTRYRAPDPYYAPPYGVRDAPPPAYGAPPPSYSYGGGVPSYGAPPPAYGVPPPYAATPAGYPYAQPGGYGQPTGYGQPAGYGYGQTAQPVVVEEKKKSKFGGMGMGTGLAVGAVAGALGGLALAEGIDKLEDHVADEAAEKVEDDLATGNDDYYGGDDGGDDGW